MARKGVKVTATTLKAATYICVRMDFCCKVMVPHVIFCFNSAVAAVNCKLVFDLHFYVSESSNEPVWSESAPISIPMPVSNLVIFVVCFVVTLVGLLMHLRNR